jgi:hypothetical protein
MIGFRVSNATANQLTGNSCYMFDEDQISAAVYLDGRVQAHTRDSAIRGNQWRCNDRRNRQYAVMLQDNQKRMLSATDRV